MRHAFVVAPLDPTGSDVGVWSDAVDWLRPTLAKLGFRVTLVEGRGDVHAEAAQALDPVRPRDTLLLFISGWLAQRGVLRLAQGARLPLRVLGDLLSQRGITDVSVVTELVHEGDSQDPLFANEHVDAVVEAFEARDRGYGVVAAVRAASSGIEGLAFTRLLMKVAASTRPEDALLSKTFGRVASMPERWATVQGLAFERGNLDLRLAPVPRDEELDRLIAAATDANDWQDVVELRRERLAMHTSPRARARELVLIARVLQTELDDAASAVGALEEARTIEPTHIPVLQALRRAYERLERWAAAIETVGALADLAETPSDRAELNYGRARLVLDRLDDAQRAIELLEETLQDDPAHERARVALREARARRDASEEELDPEDLEEDADEEDDGSGARASEESAPRVDSSLPASSDPMDAAAHEEAYALHRLEGGTDRALLAALALEELGSADLDQQVLVDQFRTKAPVPARTTLDAGAWALLRAPGCDDAIEALFGAVARTAIAVRIEDLVARGGLVELDPATRLDDDGADPISRTFHWAAGTLGVPCPALYRVDPVQGEIAAVRATEPSTTVSPSVEERSPKELAFLAARHLTYYRPANEVIVCYPTRRELTWLLFASVQIVRPRTTPLSDADVVAALRDRIAGKIRDDEREALHDAVRLLESRGGRASLAGWTRGVEMTAARAGLLLCGDLATATSVVRTESRDVAELSVGDKRRDLIAFCVSEAHAALRVRLAVTAPESVPRPASFAAGTSRETAVEASAGD